MMVRKVVVRRSVLYAPLVGRSDCLPRQLFGGRQSAFRPFTFMFDPIWPLRFIIGSRIIIC